MANQYGGGPKFVNCVLIFLVVYLNSSHAQSNTTTNPLEESDVLKTYRLGNHLQCERLCWYRKLCARFSFNTKRDNPGGNTDNCVLHAFNGSEPQQRPLLEGWTSALASGDSLASGHPCKTRPCGELHVCVPVTHSGYMHTCTKAPETDMNNCASSPCVNGGTCQDLINEYNCMCVPGFGGNNCQTETNECASSPCQNGGNCTDQLNGYVCACGEGFHGDNCQIDLWLNDACTTNSNCTLDVKAVCKGGRCVCDGATGFFFSHSDNACVAVCSGYHPTVYTRYIKSDFFSHDIWNEVSTVESCKTRCSNDATCTQFVWTPYLTCWAKTFTAQDDPSAWRFKESDEVYQKTCI